MDGQETPRPAHDDPGRHDGPGAHGEHHKHKHHHKRKGNIGNGTSEDMILLATSLATQIARGKTECELETLINVLDILQDVMISILAQRRICNRQALEIIQGGNDVIISG